jgi:POTRA domain, FtsQ-type
MKIPISRALIFIFLSVIVISGPAFLGLLYYQSLIAHRSEDSRYLVRSIITTSSALPLNYLCELLDLSCDQPKNLYLLSRQEMERKLLASPLIKKAHVRKILPDKLWIHYTARKPVALLGDYQNTAIDQGGNIFPFHPFFTGMELPTYYLGGQKNGLCIAMELHKLVLNSHLDHIDVTHMNDKSLGKREIVVALEEESRRYFLRLTPDNFAAELTHFQKVRKMCSKDSVVDLRLPDLAFIHAIL